MCLFQYFRQDSRRYGDEGTIQGGANGCMWDLQVQRKDVDRNYNSTTKGREGVVNANQVHQNSIIWYQEIGIQSGKSKRSPFLGAFAKFRKPTSSFGMSLRLSVHPYGTTRLPLNIFSKILYLRILSKIWQYNSSLIKIGYEKRVFYKNTD